LKLSGKQRRHLRGLGHNLSPIVQLGKDGLTEALISAVDEALEHHELIKVRILPSALIERDEAGSRLAKETRSELAQVLGNTVLLYRKNPEEPKIRLP